MPEIDEWLVKRKLIIESIEANQYVYRRYHIQSKKMIDEPTWTLWGLFLDMFNR